MRNFENHMHLVGQCAPWKIANNGEQIVLQALQFQMLTAASFQAEEMTTFIYRCDMHHVVYYFTETAGIREMLCK